MSQERFRDETEKKVKKLNTLFGSDLHSFWMFLIFFWFICWKSFWLS